MGWGCREPSGCVMALVGPRMRVVQEVQDLNLHCHSVLTWLEELKPKVPVRKK
jgi:hypothetical protein